MANPKNTEHLKRGGISPEAQQKGLAAMKAAREEKAAVVELAKKDPYAAYDEIHATMTTHIVTLLKAEQREKGLPQREITDRLREYRQLTDSLAAYRQTKGEAEQAQQFFAALASRLTEANFSELSPSGPPKKA